MKKMAGNRREPWSWGISVLNSRAPRTGLPTSPGVERPISYLLNEVPRNQPDCCWLCPLALPLAATREIATRGQSLTTAHSSHSMAFRILFVCAQVNK